VRSARDRRAALEVVGLGLVFVELAVIRSYEFGIPSPWARIVGRIRRLLKRPQVVELKAALEASSAMAVRAKVRPGGAPPDATEHQRIERLQRYVERLDEDLDGMWEALSRRADEVIAEAARRDEQVREEFERREADRRAKLRPSLIRQATGAAFVLTGPFSARLAACSDRAAQQVM
jgi:hypothetical protein